MYSYALSFSPNTINITTSPCPFWRKGFKEGSMYTKDFTLVREEQVQEVFGTARLWKHNATGAEVLSISNNDENKCFGVTLRTPPADSSGVAHILEHSVLCGSEKFPVREPFVELLKGSLQTFLNAFTFPDKTCYPVASTNTQDFYNLIDVYIDAVFHPRISEDIFRQEGWHVEAESADEPWTFKGVVYNEMKGVYSSPDSILAEQSQQSLFPDMIYSLDSGGHPKSILTLSYDAFKEFHASYYHPSNARFFFWGDDAEDRRLEIVGAELARHTVLDPAKKAASAIALQQKLDMPRHIEVPYASSEDDNKAMFTVNWLLCETADVTQALTFEMLEHILEGLPGSPLRKALIESGLGEDTTGIGLESDLRQMYYSVGLKGVHARDLHEAEMLIHETLAALAEDGIDQEAVEAAVNSVEFSLRENNSGRFPRGLSAMVQSLSTWLYDGDALASLAWEKPLATIKGRLAKGEKVFEQCLKEWFLNNEHRSTVILLPDASLEERRAQEEVAHLARIQEACSPEERQELVQETLRLRALQEEADSPEALATIPCVGVEDLPLQNTPLPIEIKGIEKQRFIAHDIDTSGVAYVNVLLPLSAVPQRLLPLVPLLGRALIEMGTQKRDFVSMGMYMAAKTGGVGASAYLSTQTNGAPVAYLSVGGKAVRDKVGDLFAILEEVLLQPNFDQQERFSQMLLEAKARLEHGLVAAGHSAVASRIRASLSLTGWLEELTGGVSFLHTVRALSQQAEENWASVLADLQELYSLIVNGSTCLVDSTADAQTLALVEPKALSLMQSLPAKSLTPASDWLAPSFAQAEIFTAPAQINYVAKGANLYDLGYKYHGSAQVILRHLRMGYLWEKVRVQGGAYGAFCLLDRLSGSLVQASYRDPAVKGTLATYDATDAYLRAFDPDARTLSGAIVGAIGDLDTYLLPDAKGAASLARHLCGDTDASRQQMRDEILSTTKQHFQDFAHIMQKVAEQGRICVLGGALAQKTAEEEGWSVQKLL